VPVAFTYLEESLKARSHRNRIRNDQRGSDLRFAAYGAALQRHRAPYESAAL